MLRVPFGLVLLSLVFVVSGSARSQDGKKEADAENDKNRARLRVILPANAKLTIDDSPTNSTGPDRLFITPPLEPGKTFKYTLKAIFNESGVDTVRMGVIQAEAGRESRIDLRKEGGSSQIIYVPTAENIVNRMLQMAKVAKDDIVFDLGCGDGRIVVTAAKRHGVRGVGVDIDPARIKDSRANVAKEMVGELVEIRQGDALKVPDISKATVVMLYMLPEFQRRLAPILKKELKPGARVVAHDYPLPDWIPAETVSIMGPFRQHRLYLYHVGDEE